MICHIMTVPDKGNKYILMAVDYVAKYPDAVALPRIETERVAEALFHVVSRVCFPTEILGEKGSKLTSDLMKEVCRLISLKQLFIFPYNPKFNGLCEIMNGVLKSMLKENLPKETQGLGQIFICSFVCIHRSSTGINRVLTI